MTIVTVVVVVAAVVRVEVEREFASEYIRLGTFDEGLGYDNVEGYGDRVVVVVAVVVILIRTIGWMTGGGVERIGARSRIYHGTERYPAHRPDVVDFLPRRYPNALVAVRFVK